MVGQALTGKHNSIPKVTSLKADDDKKVVFKEIGNNHSYPFMWCDTISMNGTEAVVASGVVFHGYELATHGNITITPKSAVTTPYYVTTDTANNVVKIESTASITSDFYVQIMLGANSDSRFIEKLVCRGNNSVTPNY